MLSDLLGTRVAREGTEDVGWNRGRCILRIDGVAQRRTRRMKVSPEGEPNDCSMPRPPADTGVQAVGLRVEPYRGQGSAGQMSGADVGATVGATVGAEGGSVGRSACPGLDTVGQAGLTGRGP